MTLSTVLIEREVVYLHARAFGEPRPAGQFGHAVPKCDIRMVMEMEEITVLSPVTSGTNPR